MKRIYIIFFYLFFILIASAQSNYPSPKDSKTRLFYIQHSLSKNTYVYDVNLNENKIVPHTPIHVYRILFEEKGQIANLTMPQRKLAYGYNAQKVNDQKYNFTIVAYKNQKMNLIKRDEKYVVETTVNNRSMLLDKMFIKVKDNSNSLKVEVEYILFSGKDSKSGQKINEKFLMSN